MSPTQRRGPGPATTGAKRAAQLERHIETVLAQAPRLTDEQRNRLAELLRPARRSGAA